MSRIPRILVAATAGAILALVALPVAAAGSTASPISPSSTSVAGSGTPAIDKALSGLFYSSLNDAKKGLATLDDQTTAAAEQILSVIGASC